MTPPGDRLAQTKARPLQVEAAVRAALRDAVAWRIGGGAAPNADAFAAAAVASARQVLDAAAFESSERSRTLSAVQRSARCFAASPLGRRLMAIPASQLLRLPPTDDGPDAIIRDSRRRLHAIVLQRTSDTFEGARTATRIARATPVRVADRLAPLTVHVFSLTTGRRQEFVRDVRRTSSDSLVA